MTVANPREGSLAYRALDDGRELCIYPTMPGQFRLTLGEQGVDWFDDAWCIYPWESALWTLETWDGEGECPAQWHRHIGSARRREYDADGVLVREWVAR